MNRDEALVFLREYYEKHHKFPSQKQMVIKNGFPFSKTSFKKWFGNTENLKTILNVISYKLLEVRKFIKENGDELISDGYVNSKQLLDIKCGACNEIYKQNLDRFKGGYQHARCPAKLNSKVNKINPDIHDKKISKQCVICSKKYKVVHNIRQTCSNECKVILNTHYNEKSNKINNTRKYNCIVYSENIRKLRYETKKDKICETCGESNINLLEFAHYTRENKDCHLGHTYSPQRLEKELKKGRFLCVWCHRLETQYEMEIIKNANMKRWVEDHLDDNIEECKTNTQICNGLLCKGLERPIDKFYVTKSGIEKGRIRKECKRCMAYKDKHRRKTLSEYINSEKIKQGKCDICNIKVSEDTLMCFEWDHINPMSKEYTISLMVSKKKNINIIKTELEKCRLLCCKCHRLHTIKQLGHTDYNCYNYEKNITSYKIKYNINT